MLDMATRHPDISEAGGTFALREAEQSYRPHFGGKNDLLRQENALYWEETHASTEA
jgi:hypothetical protein